MVVVAFGAPALTVIALDPWLFPVAVLLGVHGWLICRLQAGRAVSSLFALEPPSKGGADAGAEGVAIGLLGDLLGHRERDLLQRSGLVLERGRLGIWLLGERGALLVRPGGRRVFSFGRGAFNPVVSDGRMIFLTGYSSLYGLRVKQAR